MRIARAQHYNCPIQILISFPPKSSLKCPSCQTVYNSQDGGWETSLLPCPIVDQINTKGAIIIKPSYGSIQEYSLGEDLHIGISNSRSMVYSFWANGIDVHDDSWRNSIIVCDLFPFFFNVAELLDSAILNFQLEYLDKFKAKDYDEINWSCFDFVSMFLKFINYQWHSKPIFTEEFIKPSLKSTVNYCILLSKLKSESVIPVV